MTAKKIASSSGVSQSNTSVAHADRCTANPASNGGTPGMTDRHTDRAAREIGANAQQANRIMRRRCRATAAAVVDAEAPCVVRIQHDVSCRHARLDRRREARQFFGAEVFVQRQQRDPVAPLCGSSARSSAVAACGCRFEQVHAGVAAAQAAADFGLKLVPRLRRVPARRPRKRQQLRRPIFGCRRRCIPPSKSAAPYRRPASNAARARTRSRAPRCGRIGGAARAPGSCRACETPHSAPLRRHR